MSNLFSDLTLLAHLRIGLYFAFLGCWNIYHWVPLLAVMAKKGIPHPYLVLPTGISLQIIAGVMIIFNIFPKLAAFLLIFPTIITMFIFHPFWQFQGETRALNFTIFVANMTVVLGALVLLLAK